MWAVVQYILGGISISQNPPASQIKTMNQTTTAHAQQQKKSTTATASAAAATATEVAATTATATATTTALCGRNALPFNTHATNKFAA